MFIGFEVEIHREELAQLCLIDLVLDNTLDL